MKKRIFSLLLAGMMCLSIVFSLASCKDDTTDDTKDTGKVTETVLDTNTNAVTESDVETDDGATDVDINTTVDNFMKEVPCGTHAWVHMQFMASDSLTEEALGNMVLEKMGLSNTRYKVDFNKDEFEAYHESYAAEGDGSQAGDYISLTVTDTKTNEVSKEIKPYFRIIKDLEATEPNYTVCPDEK